MSAWAMRPLPILETGMFPGRNANETDQHWLWQHGQRKQAHRHRKPRIRPIKRIVQEARDKGVLIDATYGRRTRAVLITDSDHVVLSAVQPETVANRLNDTDEEEEELEDE